MEPPFEIRVLWWCGCRVLYVREKDCSHNFVLCIFSLIIVKSLQLRGRRQIAEPRKYCLVRVIVFFGVCFSLFFLLLTGWEFGLIPYIVRT